jgi:hypothetical protein
MMLVGHLPIEGDHCTNESKENPFFEGEESKSGGMTEEEMKNI